MFYIYILYSESHNKYYVGHTDDVARRLKEHNELSEGKYTTKYRPWIIVRYFAVGESRGIARRIENHIKRQKSRDYIASLVQGDSIKKLMERFKENG